MRERYSRQELFKPIQQKGQQLLSEGHVLVVGVGALGSASAEALVRAGIRKLTMIDRDYVEWSNLQRQQLYTEQDAKNKTPKVIAAKARLQSINSEVQIEAHILDACSKEFEYLLDDVDVILDATDNFDTRFLMNDLSAKHTIPWIYGSCIGSYGATYTIIPDETPCLQCLFDVIPNAGMTCDTAGIISPAVQIVAAYQVAETMKLLTDNKASVRKSYLTFDAWQNQHFEMNVSAMRKVDCPCCGEGASHPYLAYENQSKLDVLCGRDAIQIRPAKPIQYDFEQLAQQLEVYGAIQQNPYLISCQAKDFRFILFQDGRVVIHGVQDIQRAKTIYYKLLG